MIECRRSSILDFAVDHNIGGVHDTKERQTDNGSALNVFVRITRMMRSFVRKIWRQSEKKAL